SRSGGRFPSQAKFVRWWWRRWWWWWCAGGDSEASAAPARQLVRHRRVRRSPSREAAAEAATAAATTTAARTVVALARAESDGRALRFGQCRAHRQCPRFIFLLLIVSVLVLIIRSLLFTPFLVCHSLVLPRGRRFACDAILFFVFFLLRRRGRAVVV